MTKPVARVPSGFNFGYRPASYFNNLDPQTVIVASILGEERRKDVLERLQSGNFDPLVWSEWITESRLDDSTRDLIGQCHPKYMGGEYLDVLEDEEIEIARIICASATQDVTSIRAWRKGKRITYRVVDEHEGVFELERKWSARPLTFGELIRLINNSDRERDSMANGLVFSILDWNLDSDGDPDALRGFISVSSCYYPELGRYFNEAIDQYLDGETQEDTEEDSEKALV